MAGQRVSRRRRRLRRRCRRRARRRRRGRLGVGLAAVGLGAAWLLRRAAGQQEQRDARRARPCCRRPRHQESGDWPDRRTLTSAGRATCPVSAAGPARGRCRRSRRTPATARRPASRSSRGMRRRRSGRVSRTASLWNRRASATRRRGRRSGRPAGSGSAPARRRPAGPGTGRSRPPRGCCRRRRRRGGGQLEQPGLPPRSERGVRVRARAPARGGPPDQGGVERGAGQRGAAVRRSSRVAVQLDPGEEDEGHDDGRRSSPPRVIRLGRPASPTRSGVVGRRQD